MGGNALKNITTRRYARSEFEPLRDYVVAQLSPYYTSVQYLKYYRTKESFGDLDVLVGWDDKSTAHSRDIITRLFSPTQMVSNGEVVSFNVDELQVDLIHVPTNKTNIAATYYGWNDLGNFMGRVAHKFGMKYGHKGLLYPVRFRNTHLLEEMRITDEPHVIFEFLGFDYYQWSLGFGTMEDIFDYVIESKFFSSDIFAYENLNHINRTRNRKRASYASFVQYIASKPTKLYHFDDRDYLQEYDSAYGTQFSIKRDTMLREAQVASDFRSRVIAIAKSLGLQGPELGGAVARVREMANMETDEQIRDEIKKLCAI